MFARNLLKQTEKRFRNCGTTNKWYAVAHLLDPDAKGIVLKEFGVFDRTLSLIHEMCRKYVTDQEENVTPETQEMTDHDDESNLSAVERLKKRRRISGDTPASAPAPTAASRVETEVQRYLNMPDETCDDPLKWWKENKGGFVILRKLAGEVLSIPASSATSERAFSAGTRVRLSNFVNVMDLILIFSISFQACNPHRLRMSPQTISDLMMINLNHRDIEDYKEKVGITSKYTGTITKLVDVEFPDEMENIGEPPVHEDVGLGYDVEDEIGVDSDNYSESDDSDECSDGDDD